MADANTQSVIFYRIQNSYVHQRHIIVRDILTYSGTRYLRVIPVSHYAMSSHTRETANFSQMDETMRRLGSWEPRPAANDA